MGKLTPEQEEHFKALEDTLDTMDTNLEQRSILTGLKPLDAHLVNGIPIEAYEQGLNIPIQSGRMTGKQPSTSNIAKNKEPMTTRQLQPAPTLEVGKKVHHNTYGNGIIQKISPSGSIIEVGFTRYPTSVVLSSSLTLLPFKTEPQSTKNKESNSNK